MLLVNKQTSSSRFTSRFISTPSDVRFIHLPWHTLPSFFDKHGETQVGKREVFCIFNWYFVVDAAVVVALELPQTGHAPKQTERALSFSSRRAGFCCCLLREKNKKRDGSMYCYEYVLAKRGIFFTLDRKKLLLKMD